MKKTNIHLSDCAVYNEPAYPKGKCNCGYEFNSIDKIIKQIEDCNFESDGGYLKDNIAYNRLKWLLYQTKEVLNYQILNLHLDYTKDKKEGNRFLVVSKTVDGRWDVDKNKQILHSSDCAIYNMPEKPKKECDCQPSN